MTKDRVGFRTAVKFAHGSRDAEQSIGITATRFAESNEQNNTNTAARLVGLIKWSYDDFIVEELLRPNTLLGGSDGIGSLSATSSVLTGTSIVVAIHSEGVPDTVIEGLLRQRCTPRVHFHFLTPVDFVSSATRHVWIRSSDQAVVEAFARPQVCRTADGEVRLGAGKLIGVPSTAAYFPLHLLPDLRYTIVLRGLRGSLAEVLPRLNSLHTHGFLNYCHMARHGLGTFRSFQSGRDLIQRDYVSFLQNHVRTLTEGAIFVQREMAGLQEMLANPRASPRDWRGIAEAFQYALKEDETVMRKPQTGLYHPHHGLLRDFVERAAHVAPKHNDSAQVIRESISALVMAEKVRSVSEVNFNAMASLRWHMYGARVAVGDLVVGHGAGDEAVEGRCMTDIFEGAADHVNGSMTSSAHPDWMRLGEQQLQTFHSDVRVVQTEAEAQSHSIHQVVLPFFGREVQHLPVLPAHRSGDQFHKLARELQIEGLPLLRSAALASYRHLVAKPRDLGFYLVDEQRGWEWVDGPRGKELKQQLYKDKEGILRVRSPLAMMTERNMIARKGIRGTVARNFFAKPARRPGILCVLQMTLPRGSPPTSALREVFQCATLSPAAIYRLVS